MRIFFMAIILAPFAYSQANAEIFSAQTLQNRCASEISTDNAKCMSYVRGFVEGAITTDPRVVERVVAESTELSPWMRRAIATRAGQRIEQLGGAVYASICLGSSLNYADVVAHLAKTPAVADPDQPAREWLYSELRAQFPCS